MRGLKPFSDNLLQSVCMAFAGLMSAPPGSAAGVSGLEPGVSQHFLFFSPVQLQAVPQQGCPLLSGRTENNKHEPTENRGKWCYKTVDSLSLSSLVILLFGISGNDKTEI